MFGLDAVNISTLNIRHLFREQVRRAKWPILMVVAVVAVESNTCQSTLLDTMQWLCVCVGREEAFRALAGTPPPLLEVILVVFRRKSSLLYKNNGHKICISCFVISFPATFAQPWPLFDS